MAYNADSPIDSDNDNVFSGRREYAVKIVEAIDSLDKNQSYVIGLYSSWGYGKTSLINMIKNNLNTLNNDDNHRIYYFDIEPWSFMSAESMVGKIYYEIYKRICEAEKSDSNLSKKQRCKKFFRTWKNKLFSFTLSKKNEISTSVHDISSSNKKIAPFINILTNFGFSRIKKSLEKQLEKSHDIDKVVVFIDDIDRLNTDEILNVFKIVKSIANMKGVIFFLAFDYDIVAKALNMNHESPENGEKYIEKIIQIPLELSRIRHDELMHYFEDGVMDILKDNNILLDKNDEQWIKFLLIFNKIKNEIKTPRSANRILNGMRFMIPMLKNDTNIYDLMSIELIRVLHVDVYDKIWKSKYLLTKYNDYGLDPFGTDEDAKHEIEKIFKDSIIIEILSYLFPTVAKVCFSRVGIRDDRQDRLKKKICSLAYFDRYFSYSMGKDDISDDDFLLLVQSKSPTNKQVRCFIDNPHKCDNFLEKLRDNRDVIAGKHNLLVTLILTLESFNWAFSDENRLYSPMFLASETVDDILSGNDMVSERNLKIFLDIVNNCERLETLSYIVRRVYLDNDSTRNNEKMTLTINDYSSFKQRIIEIIKSAVDDKKLPLFGNDVMLREMYKYYVLFSNDNTVINEYMKSGVKNEEEAIDFITQFLNYSIEAKTTIKYWENLLYNDSEPYRNWFVDVFDAKYLYDIISQSQAYSKYKNLKFENVPRFKDVRLRSDKSQTINMGGNEHTKEFKKVVACQFMYDYETIGRDSK